MTSDAKAVRWEKVYVFISSTFSDMHAERDFLVKRVFPELQGWCERRKLRLVDIDLRWGVTEADTTSKRAVEVCLEHINDCRPFFICFLGQRHGWVPGVAGVSDDTFEKFPDLREAIHTAASVTELEIRHAILKPFASRDPQDPDRLVEYQPSEYAFFYFRDPGYLNDLPKTPRQLLCACTDEVGPEDETDEELERRELSRQALSALREQTIPEKARHRPVVYSASWWAELETPELAMPLECSSVDEANIHRWRDQWNRFAHLGLAETDFRVPETKQSAANDYNAALTRGRLSQFRSLNEARDQFPPGADLARVIRHDLQQAILARYPEHTEVEHEDELQKEIDQQEEFLFTSSQGFIERVGDFDELDAYVEGPSNQLFALTAPGGMGKSTLLANWIDHCRTRIEANPEQSVHFRFIGASDRSTTVYSLLRSLLREILETKKLDEEIPADPNKLREALRELLAAIGKSGKTVIVLDALNQLETSLRDLHWLPQTLPQNIKLIISFKRDDDASEQAYQQFKAAQATLVEVRPFAELEDRRRLVRAYLEQYLKELDEPHLETLIAIDGASNPLYLKVVLSELRVFGAFAGLAEKIRRDFGDNPITAFQGVLKRLESDPAYSPIEPQRAVPLLFGLLAHARHGLSVEELTSLFVQALQLEDDDQWRQAAADTINFLLRQVRPFLARRKGNYDYFYESFKLAARQCYLATHPVGVPHKRTVQQYHLLLANYFESLPTWQKEPTSSGSKTDGQPTWRKVAELSYHLTQAEQWDRLEEALCDLKFIEAKCTAGMTYQLVDDYQAGLAATSGLAGWSGRDRVIVFSRFVRKQAYILKGCATLAFQQAANQPDSSVLAMAARKQWEKGAEKRLWMRWVNKLQQGDPCLMTLVMDSTNVIAAYSLDGKRIISGSGDGVLRVWDSETGALLVTHQTYPNHINLCACSPDGKRIVFGALYASYNGGRTELKIWDTDTGAELAPLVGHSAVVRLCAYSPDGKRIVSGSDDGMLKIWNAETGEELATFVGHSDVTSACAYSPDGKRIVSGSGNGSLKVWDAETGAELATFVGHSDVISACAYSPDGKRIVSGSMNGRLKVWGAETGAELATFVGHSGSILSCAYSPDGKQIVSGAYDGTLKVWDAETDAEETTFREHSDYVLSCAYSPDGKRIVSGSSEALKVYDAKTGAELTTLASGRFDSCVAYSPDGKRILGRGDGKLKVWDAETGEELATFREHSGSVFSCAYSPDGKRIVSRAYDETLKVWDAETGEELATFVGHAADVLSCAYSPDGKRIVSGAYDGTLKVWDAETGEELATFGEHSGSVFSCAYSPDGKRIVSGSGNGSLKVWDAETTTEVVTLKDHSWEGYSCGFETDGKRITSGSKFRAHLGRVISCAYSPDGSRIVSGSYDGTLKLWDVETGAVVGIFVLGSDATAVAIGMAGQNIAAGDQIGRFYILSIISPEVTTPIITLVHLYKFNRRYWDAKPTAKCEWCGKRFTPYRTVLDAIKNIIEKADLDAGESACAKLPAESWDDPQLLVKCPYCYHPLKFNPFIVDTRGRQPRFKDHAALRGLMDSTLRESPVSFSGHDWERPPIEPTREYLAKPIFIPMPHPSTDPERAAQLNIQYQQELSRWKVLPWWKRLMIKKPTPPTGI